MSKLVGAVLAGMVSSLAMADSGLSTAPVISTAAPAVTTATTAKPLNPAPRVEVFAFTPISNLNQNDWTGRGIQENLQSDISRTGATLVLAPHPPGSSEDLVGFAKQNHADLAVIGSYQIVGNQIRVNGHVTDVATNATVGGFAATGAQQDLFKVEDALGEQLRALLPPSATPQQVHESYEQQPPVIYSETTPAPAVNNYYDTQPAPTYYYPDNDYYPYDDGFYGGFGFYPGFYYGGGYGRGYAHHGGYDHGYGNHFSPSPVYHGGGGAVGGFHGGSGGGGGFHGGFSGGHGGGGGHR